MGMSGRVVPMLGTGEARENALRQGASSLHSESSKDGGVAAVGLGGEVAGAWWGSPGCSTQSPELRSDLCGQWEAFGEFEAGVQQDPVTV